jgi:hypothetical protein
MSACSGLDYRGKGVVRAASARYKGFNALRRSKLRFRLWPLMQRFAVIVMMTAALAFVLQGTLIARSDAATGEAGHFHHGHFQHEHTDQEHSHVLTHVHVDGTIHRHAIDDDEDLADHIKEHGCPCCTAMVVGNLPSLNICPIIATVAYRLDIERPIPLTASDPGGLTRPPRPPCIA